MLALTVKNISHQDFPKATAYINISGYGIGDSGVPWPSVDVHPEYPAALKAGDIRTELIGILGPNNHYVPWAVAWLVVSESGKHRQ